jgi:MFS family permease
MKVGSILCASAPSSPVFIFGRAIAGVGAAGIFQGALGVVGFIAPLEKRPTYFGIVISVFGLATCFGPIMGGAFTDHASWRWCFWMFVLSEQLTFDQ